MYYFLDILYLYASNNIIARKYTYKQAQAFLTADDDEEDAVMIIWLCTNENCSQQVFYICIDIISYIYGKK